MAIPAWTRWLFAAALAVVCAFCLARLAVLRRPGRAAGMPHWHEDSAQVLMGIGMIAMFLSFSGVLPKPVWVVLFLGMAAGFAAPMLLRSGHRTAPEPGVDSWSHVHHVMAGLAMAYMLVAIGPILPSGAMGAVALAPLAASFGMYFLGYTVFSGARLVTGSRLAVAGAPVTGPALLRAPRLVEGCRTVMGLGMAWMLLSMM